MRQWNISSDAEISKSINYLFRSYALVWYSLTKRITTFNCASVFRSTSYKLECFSKLLRNPSIGHHQDIDQIHTWTIHNYSISYDHFIRVHDEDIVRRIDIIFYLYFIFCRFRVGSGTRFSYEFYSIEAGGKFKLRHSIRHDKVLNWKIFIFILFLSCKKRKL